MQVLEKILQEIEEAKKEPLFRLVDAAYRDKQNQIVSRIEEIIRSHMADEPVSNPDKLDAGWISVAEQLPETSGDMIEEEKLLILLPNGIRTVAFYVDTENAGKIFFDGWDVLRPIAWQPLPAPYHPKKR